jgi:hypothetical protein
MKTRLFSRNIKTGDITAMSNLTSVTVNGTRISRVEEITGHERENPSAIYIDFAVQHPTKMHDVLEATEEVDLIFNLDDAVELGLLMVAMGMEHKTDDDITKILSRLSKLIAEYR